MGTKAAVGRTPAQYDAPRRGPRLLLTEGRPHAAQDARTAGDGGVALAVGAAGLVDQQPVDAAAALVAEHRLLGVGAFGRAGADAVALQLGLADAAPGVGVTGLAEVHAPALEGGPAERAPGQAAAALVGDARVALAERVEPDLGVQALRPPGVGPAERQAAAIEIQRVGPAHALVGAGDPAAAARADLARAARQPLAAPAGERSRVEVGQRGLAVVGAHEGDRVAPHGGPRLVGVGGADPVEAALGAGGDVQQERVAAAALVVVGGQVPARGLHLLPTARVRRDEAVEPGTEIDVEGGRATGDRRDGHDALRIAQREVEEAVGAARAPGQPARVRRDRRGAVEAGHVLRRRRCGAHRQDQQRDGQTAHIPANARRRRRFALRARGGDAIGRGGLGRDGVRGPNPAPGDRQGGQAGEHEDARRQDERHREPRLGRQRRAADEVRGDDAGRDLGAERAADRAHDAVDAGGDADLLLRRRRRR